MLWRPWWAPSNAVSRILRKLAAYPLQNDLAAALREVGRIKRTLFIIEWILDAGIQRRAQIGLNKASPQGLCARQRFGRHNANIG